MCLYLFEYGEQNVVTCLNVDIGEQSRPVHLTTEYGEMQGATSSWQGSKIT